MVKFGRKCDMWKSDVNSTAYFPENWRVNRENWVVVVVSTKGWNIPVVRRGKKGELSAKSISRTTIIQLERWHLLFGIYLQNWTTLYLASCKGIRIPESGKFLLMQSEIQRSVAVESGILASGIQLKESGIPLKIGIRKPTFTDKETKIHYREPGIHSMESRIQDCVNWIPLHGATLSHKLRSTIT